MTWNIKKFWSKLQHFYRGLCLVIVLFVMSLDTLRLTWPLLTASWLLACEPLDIDLSVKPASCVRLKWSLFVHRHTHIVFKFGGLLAGKLTFFQPVPFCDPCIAMSQCSRGVRMRCTLLNQLKVHCLLQNGLKIGFFFFFFFFFFF